MDEKGESNRERRGEGWRKKSLDISDVLGGAHIVDIGEENIVTEELGRIPWVLRGGRRGRGASHSSLGGYIHIIIEDIYLPIFSLHEVILHEAVVSAEVHELSGHLTEGRVGARAMRETKDALMLTSNGDEIAHRRIITT